MIVTFGNVDKDKTHLNKTYDSKYTKDILLKNRLDLKNPTLYIEYDENLLSCNYFHIQSPINLFYYITSKVINNGVIEIVGACDGLFSYRDDVKQAVVHATRSTSGNNYIVDGLAKQGEKTSWSCRNLGSIFTEGDNYIVSIGGK